VVLNPDGKAIYQIALALDKQNRAFRLCPPALETCVQMVSAFYVNVRTSDRSNFGPIQRVAVSAGFYVSDTRCSTYFIFAAFCASRGSGVRIPSRPPEPYFSRFCNLRCNFNLLFCSTDFWSIWSNNALWQIETEAHSLGLCQAQFKLLVKVRVELRHGLRFVRHPEVVEVFQTASPTQPRFTESLKRVPAHSRFVQSHFGKARRELAVFEIAVEMGRTTCGVEQKAGLPGSVASQELCNVRERSIQRFRSSADPCHVPIRAC
jgi:hypothetical protein